jgi:hypothetical protein
MYYTGFNTLKAIHSDSKQVFVAKGLRQRRLQKAFLRYHDPKNWPMLREALKNMGRADLIGNGKRHLVPSWQPQDGKKASALKKSKPFVQSKVAVKKRSPLKSKPRRKS